MLVGGFNPSEQYEFASLDDDIPNIWKINQMFQTTNQQLEINPFWRGLSLNSLHFLGEVVLRSLCCLSKRGDALGCILCVKA